LSRQIADPLETAPECGVVHRDLKPANANIRPDGTVKVIDFGVAKLLNRRESSSAEATMTVDSTAIGTPTPLFEIRLSAHPDRNLFAAYESDVDAAGSRFLVNRMVTPPETSLTVITGWPPPR
jgi:serine/threonine protein kinase